MSSYNGRPDILTRSGQYFDFLEPHRYRVDVADIAHGLSNCCRFVGQCRTFYSVAQHSVYVSRIVPDEHAMAGLMHDAAEAFLGDVSRPLKHLLADYREIERRVEEVLFEQLGVPFPLPDVVKHADLQMLHAEQLALMPRHSDEWACLKGVSAPPGIIIHPISHEEAFDAFMERLDELK